MAPVPDRADGPGVLATVARSEEAGDRIYILRTPPGEPSALTIADPLDESVASYIVPHDEDEEEWILAVSEDGRACLCARPAGHLFLFDSHSEAWADLGEPFRGDSVLSMSSAPGGLLYAGTSPHAELYRHDHASGETQSLGRMHTRQPDLLHLVVDADGNVYCGLGPDEASLVRYNPDTAHKTDLLPRIYRSPGHARPVMGSDDVVYVTVGDRLFEIEGNACIPTFPADFPGERDRVLADGRELGLISHDAIALRNPDTGETSELKLVP